MFFKKNLDTFIVLNIQIPIFQFLLIVLIYYYDSNGIFNNVMKIKEKCDIQ